MHEFDEAAETTARQVFDLILERLRADRGPLGGPVDATTLAERAGRSVTSGGIGPEEALRRWQEVLAPANIACDHPRYLAYIPHAPTPAAVLFDLLVGASGLYAGSWLEASGAVHAENEALRWLADLAGFPASAGGTFVPGGTAGNLSALHAARHAGLARRDGARPARWRVAASPEAHSSVAQAAQVLDVELVPVPADARGRLTGEALRAALPAPGDGADDGLFAVVASAGATNLGVVDDLAGIAAVCAERGLWLHIDGAYGLAALAAPSARPRFAGIERADSFIVDPHKWLFAPYDACALVYRDARPVRAAHSQSAAYLDTLNARDEWNPSDYATQLSRRARGLPFWFSLAVHGTEAYAAAVETTLALARKAADLVRADPDLELLAEPELGVVVFRRRGWAAADYDTWAERLREAGTAFVMPTRVDGEAAARIVLLNPRTTLAEVSAVVGSLGRRR